jgi:hypothetical protein
MHRDPGRALWSSQHPQGSHGASCWGNVGGLQSGRSRVNARSAEGGYYRDISPAWLHIQVFGAVSSCPWQAASYPFRSIPWTVWRTSYARRRDARRITLRWYPIRGYQQDQPSLLLAPLGAEDSGVPSGVGWLETTSIEYQCLPYNACTRLSAAGKRRRGAD